MNASEAKSLGAVLEMSLKEETLHVTCVTDNLLTTQVDIRIVIKMPAIAIEQTFKSPFQIEYHGSKSPTFIELQGEEVRNICTQILRPH